MAGIRGVQPFMPSAGGKPTGMFSSKGSQKNDGGSKQHSGLLNYALSCDKGKVKPSSRKSK